VLEPKPALDAIGGDVAVDPNPIEGNPEKEPLLVLLLPNPSAFVEPNPGVIVVGVVALPKPINVLMLLVGLPNALGLVLV
jgi:hypothetical protein